MRKLIIITLAFMAVACKKERLPECLEWNKENHHQLSTSGSIGYFKLEEPNKIEYKITWYSAIIKGTFTINDSLIVVDGDSTSNNRICIRNFCGSNYSIVTKDANLNTITVWQ